MDDTNKERDDALAVQYIHLPSHVVKNIGIPKNDSFYDDAISIGMETLLLCSRGYKRDMKINFITYSYKSIWNNVMKEYIRYKQRWLMAGTEDAAMAYKNTPAKTDGISADDKMELSYILEGVDKTRRNYRILINRIKGNTLGTIGEAFDLTRERVRQICFEEIDNLKRKLDRATS